MKEHGKLHHLQLNACIHICDILSISVIVYCRCVMLLIYDIFDN